LRNALNAARPAILRARGHSPAAEKPHFPCY
jgi:hypothetical protein